MVLPLTILVKMNVILELTMVYVVGKETFHLQYADPKMAYLIKEGQAIFGSAYCIISPYALFFFKLIFKIPSKVPLYS